jgi:probable phosphoglycerate mutase
VLRVATALERITREHEGKTILVVCHGGVIDSSFVIFSGLSSVVFPTLDLGTRNTSITHWERHDDQGTPRWRLRRYNDDIHTRDIGAEERMRWPRASAPDTGGSEGTAVPLPTEGP